jgi:hypothetical protein
MNTLTILSKKILSLCGIVIISYATLSAQEDKTSDFSYQINRVQKYISISPAQLDDATTLSDLNQYYKSDWVKEYKSVKIIVISNGQKKTVTSSNDELTKKQKQLIESADLGSNIKVIVQYLPDNNLSKSEIQEMDFAFKVDPTHEAKCAGGEDHLNQYIEESIMKKVSRKDVPQYQVAAVNKDTDALLLKTICEMPKWVSAEYSDGTKTKQEFVFTIGDHYSCTMNILDIKSETPPSTQ